MKDLKRVPPVTKKTEEIRKSILESIELADKFTSRVKFIRNGVEIIVTGNSDLDEVHKIYLEKLMEKTLGGIGQGEIEVKSLKPQLLR